MSEACLVTFGWRPWLEVVPLLGDVEGFWLGSTSAVRLPAALWPEQCPVTTRIHAWGSGEPQLLWRLVPDPARGRCLVTALVPIGHEFGRTAVRSRVVSVSDERSDDGWLRTWVDEESSVMFLRPAKDISEEAA